MTSQMTIRENEMDTTLVWFNPVIDGTDNVEKIRKNLRTTNDDVLFPTGVDSCIDDIKGRETKRILLVISAENVVKLPPDIIGLPQLDSIFIFTENRERSNHLYDNYPKVVDICDNANDLINSIEENITKSRKQLKSKPFNDQHQQGTRVLSEESAELSWFQLFKNVIQNSPHDDKAKEEMLSACRKHYQNDPQMLEKIDEFDKTYREEECIRWYTKNTFVYKLINAALRTEDIEQLYVFRYYISHLSKQLAQEFKNLKQGRQNEKINLFHGGTITEEEEKKINANVGKVFAINSYWSTSLDRSYALTFAHEEMDRPDTAAILYEIECHIEGQNDSVIFADISHLSEFQGEFEYLFDAGSIFQIKNVRKEETGGNKIYVVQISTTREGQEVTKSYIDGIRVEIEYESPRIMVGIVLKRIGKYNKSLEYFEQLLKNPGDENIAHIHNRIGIALRLQQKHDLALKHYNIAYDLISKSDPPERVYLAFILHDQGQIYFIKRKRPRAFSYYQAAVDIILKEKGPENPYIAYYYTSLGRFYKSYNNYETAMEYQREALRIREACLPSSHVIHAFSYAEIAKILSSQNNYKEALSYHLKALELREKYLLSNHLNTALSLHSVGQMYHKLGDLEKARDYYRKALEMKRKCLPDSHPYITPNILQDIARTYDWKSQDALDYRLEAWNIQRLAEIVHYPSFVHLLDDIGFTYKLMGSMDDSIKFYKEALKIREEKLPKKSFSLSCSFNNLAYLHEAMKDMASAIIYHCKALEIYEYYYLNGHWLCERSRRSIQRVMR